jgi:DNA-binding winged helix-turn-helix (wHTH) protein
VRTRFGRFVLDSETRQVLRDGSEIHLSPKAFDLLCVLISRRPNVVAKADLISQIWPNTFVVDANLNVLVGEIRRALDDDTQTPRFIRTVHRVGYAFCGDAADLSGSMPAADVDKPRFWLVWRNRTFILSRGDNFIGRDPECQIWLDHSGVSRRHARIRIGVATEGAVLDDLESTNGTLLRGNRVLAQTTLTDGDIITVGSVKLTFRAWSNKQSRTKRIRG